MRAELSQYIKMIDKHCMQHIDLRSVYGAAELPRLSAGRARCQLAQRSLRRPPAQNPGIFAHETGIPGYQDSHIYGVTRMPYLVCFSENFQVLPLVLFQQSLRFYVFPHSIYRIFHLLVLDTIICDRLWEKVPLGQKYRFQIRVKIAESGLLMAFCFFLYSGKL